VNARQLTSAATLLRFLRLVRAVKSMLEVAHLVVAALDRNKSLVNHCTSGRADIRILESVLVFRFDVVFAALDLVNDRCLVLRAHFRAKVHKHAMGFGKDSAIVLRLEISGDWGDRAVESRQLRAP
jgi:hypothetical protein